MDSIDNCRVFENSQKMSYKMQWDYLPVELDDMTNKPIEKPVIFSDSFLDDPSKYLYIKLFQETRANTVNTSQTDPSLLMKSLRSDFLTGMKVGIKLNHNFVPTSISDCISIHASSKYMTNFTNMTIVKHSAFARVMTMLNKNTQLTASLSAAQILGNGATLNDHLMLKNFKGIGNLGETSGGNFGFNRYVASFAKVSYTDCPLLSAISVEPFIFGNAMLGWSAHPKAA